MKFTKTTLGEISIGKGQYGIGASAVDYSEELYTYLRISDINDDGTLSMSDLKSVDDEKQNNMYLNQTILCLQELGIALDEIIFMMEQMELLCMQDFLLNLVLILTKSIRSILNTIASLTNIRGGFKDILLEVQEEISTHKLMLEWR